MRYFNNYARRKKPKQTRRPSFAMRMKTDKSPQYVTVKITGETVNIEREFFGELPSKINSFLNFHKANFSGMKISITKNA